MKTWNEKKAAIIAALKDYDYVENQTTGNYQKAAPSDDGTRIATVYLKFQPKQGENVPVKMVNPKDIESDPSDKDIGGIIESTKQIIRKAIDSIENEQPDNNDEKTNIEKNIDAIVEHNKNVLPEKEQPPTQSKPKTPTKQKSNVPAKVEKRNGKVTPWAKDMTDAEIDRHINRTKTEKALQGGKFYSADGGSQVPDAKAIQEIANDAGIDSEIVEAIQTDDYVHVKVRSYMGKHYTEAVVHLDFKIEKNLKILEIVTKNPDILERFDGSTPIIKADVTIKIGDKYVNAQMHIVKTILRYMKFSMRAATTTAMSNTYKKLLNQEWREKEEIEMENDERFTVQDSIETEKATGR